MVRSRVNLTYIKDSRDRKATYKKRSKCLIKKTRELSTRCDVQACSIIYGPYSRTPEVWPSVEGVQEVLKRFRNMPEYQQGANRANQEMFTNTLIRRQKEKLVKQQKLNYRNDMTRVMFMKMKGEGTSRVCLEDLLEMKSICDEKLKEVDEKMKEVDVNWVGLEKMNLGGDVSPSQDVNGVGPMSGLVADPITEGVGPNILSDMPTDTTGGYEGLTDKFLELYPDFNWEDNFPLFLNTDNGVSVRPSNNNP